MGLGWEFNYRPIAIFSGSHFFRGEKLHEAGREGGVRGKLLSDSEFYILHTCIFCFKLKNNGQLFR